MNFFRNLDVNALRKINLWELDVKSTHMTTF